ncbi:Hypothetical predicted protein [Octopus vulgaris]|uniref:Uncharacterized protein n=1 Tax=Octopus vulgaris TaxID=6645 RepID=A0AA36BA73_OCTVU|nr:Hypothetical predicted protein [Octopus vulgaris]
MLALPLYVQAGNNTGHNSTFESITAKVFSNDKGEAIEFVIPWMLLCDSVNSCFKTKLHQYSRRTQAITVDFVDSAPEYSIRFTAIMCHFPQTSKEKKKKMKRSFCF